MIENPASHPPEARPEADRFRHAALFYSGERGFVDACAAFIRDGIAAAEPVLVVVSARKIELLRAELGQQAEGVCFADMAEVGTNPGAIISAWDDFVSTNHAEGLRVRGIGEPIWPGRDPQELEECHMHESLLNLAFANATGFWLACPYDVDALDPEVVEHARVTHPRVVEGGQERQSSAYAAPERAAAAFEGMLPGPPAEAYEVAFDEDSLGAMRAFVSAVAEDAGIEGERRDDLLLAVNELATNSVRHGGGEGVLRVWTEDGALVCEVADRGRIGTPLAGRTRPPSGGLSGYGLWLVNQVADLVQVRASDAGSVVRMRMRTRRP